MTISVDLMWRIEGVQMGGNLTKVPTYGDF